VLQHDVARHIDQLLYQYIAKGRIAPEIRAGRGLCNHHSWQALDYRGRALGIAIISDWALDEVLKMDSQTTPGKSGLAKMLGRDSDPLADALEPVGPCLACEHLNGAEERTIYELLNNLDDEPLMTAFRASPGLCLPHVRRVLRQIESPKQAKAFMEIQRPKWLALQAELREFKRKYDINNAGEEMGEEGDSWRRAIRYLAGEDNIFGLRR
jgi:hypothetical protein